MNILIIAMPGCGNLGDDLISEILQKAVLKKYPNAKLGLVCGESSMFYCAPSAIKLYIPRNIPGKLFRRVGIIKDFARKSDLVLIGGGGLFQDTHNYYTIHSYLHWIFFAHCPVSCVGIGVGPINYKKNITYLYKVLNREGVSIQLRDNESYSLLKQIGLNRIELSCDIVEGSSLNLKKKSTGRSVLGCSIREWPDLDVDRVVQFINIIIEKNGIEEVIFFAFEHKNDSQNEYLFLKRIASQLAHKTVVYAYGKDERFFEELCSVNLAIASRYHANIIWQKLGIPVIPIPYAPKVYSLYSKCGIDLKNSSSFDMNTQFISIDIKDCYQLPEIDGTKAVSFSTCERVCEFVYHIRYLFYSVKNSILHRLHL